MVGRKKAIITVGFQRSSKNNGLYKNENIIEGSFKKKYSITRKFERTIRWFKTIKSLKISIIEKKKNLIIGGAGFIGHI